MITENLKKNLDLLKDVYMDYEEPFTNGTWGWKKNTTYKDIGFSDEKFIEYLNKNDFLEKCAHAVNCGDYCLFDVIIMSFMYAAYQYGLKQNDSSLTKDELADILKKIANSLNS